MTIQITELQFLRSIYHHGFGCGEASNYPRLIQELLECDHGTVTNGEFHLNPTGRRVVKQMLNDGIAEPRIYRDSLEFDNDSND